MGEMARGGTNSLLKRAVRPGIATEIPVSAVGSPAMTAEGDSEGGGSLSPLVPYQIPLDMSFLLLPF